MTQMWQAIKGKKSHLLIDKHYSVRCPHCNTLSNLSAVSLPDWEQVVRFNVLRVIIGFRCDSCNEPVALRFKGNVNVREEAMYLSEEYQELERPMETFEYQHLPAAVSRDFREALICYSHMCYNAAAAMCRRTIQSMATDLGTTGSSRVEKQILEAKDVADMDDETFDGLKAVMLGGHDGAHPNLPEVSSTRAALLVEMMKDVLTQIYIRRGRIQEAMQLRQEAIAEKRGGDTQNP